MHKHVLGAMIFLILFGALLGMAADAIIMTEFQITTDSADQTEPDFDGQYVVCQDNRSGNWDIYMYDLVTQYPIIETRITNNTADQVYPAVDSGRVVWQDHRNGNWDIYLYDVKNKTETRITSNTADQQYPAIYRDRIVWQDNRSGVWGIYMYNVSSQTESQISIPCYPSSCAAKYPAIFGDTIVYQKLWPDYGIMHQYATRYDLTTGIETKISRVDVDDPGLSVYESRIVYLEYLYNWDGNGYSTDLYIDEFAGVGVHNLIKNSAWQIHPDIYGTAPYVYIVYHDNRNAFRDSGFHLINNDDVFLYILDTDSDIQVTTNKSNQQMPVIYGNTIVYQDDRNGNWDIYTTVFGFGSLPGSGENQTAETGSLYVASYPSAATILINGTEKGLTDQLVTDVPAGVQNLTLTKSGYQPYTTMVNIPVNDVKVLPPITLAKGGGVSGGKGTLYVASYPTGATILINGTSFGLTTTFANNVPAGNQNLTLLKEGYQPYTTMVNVPVNDVKVLAPVTLSRSENLGCTCPCTLCFTNTCVCVA